MKDPRDYDTWKEAITDSLSVRTPKRVFLTVDSDRFSRILKLQETAGGKFESVRRIEIEVFVKCINLSIITSDPL